MSRQRQNKFKFSEVCDPSSFEPAVRLLPRRDGCKFICDVPRELGLVTDLNVVGDHLIASTESGIPLILPTHPVLGTRGRHR